ncbi:MAG TPA: cellulase family glycosylhydrolase [Paludibacteraceae bacterium]|nr:cellulase family glycosylhydrolase [Paludibacteraceae bacterium]
MKKIFKFGVLSAFLLNSFCASLHAQKVEAEDFTKVESKSTKVITENDGKTVGYFDENGETLSYEVNIQEDGLYQFSFSSLAGKPGTIKIQMADGASCVYPFEANNATEWWNLPLNNWPIYSPEQGAMFVLKAGKQSFNVINMGNGVNLDYFEVVKASSNDSKITKISTIPTKVELMPGDSKTIEAYGYNSLGEKIAVAGTWSSNAPSGVYKAGSSEGSDVISVTMGDVSKDIKVTIANPTKKQEFVVTKHGKLNTKDDAVRDQNGNKVSLIGPSWFWSCSAPDWWTKETVDFLVSKYNIQLIRLPVSIAPAEDGANPWNDHSKTWNTNNYLHSPEYTKALVDEMVKAAIENDIYVVIDFHEHYAEQWVDLSKEFFTYFATKWGKYPNVMYEIYNEPKTSNSVVIDYAKKIIPVIRAIDDDNVIIVGSTQYSREPNNVTDAGQGYENIAYTWHGYVEWGHQADWNSHSDWNNGVPVVVTEWGLNYGKADGGLIQIYKDKSLINAFWSMSNKGGDDAKWSILKESCTKISDWSDSDMTENGAYLLGVAKSWVNYTPIILVQPQEDLSISVGSAQSFFLPQSETKLTGMADGGTGNYTYSWKQLSGPSNANIESANTAWTTVSGLTDGTYLFQLTVSDGEDELDETITITIYPEGYVDPGLVDNVEDNNIISNWGGKWNTFNDESKKANPYSAITVPESLPQNGAIKADYTMGNEWQGEGWMGAPYCGVELFLQESKEPYDISDCSKITYKYKGSAHEFRVAMKAVEDDDFHSTKISASTVWETATINWSGLAQASDWGVDMELDKSDIYKFSWQIKESANSKGTLEIDDVTCVGGSVPANLNNISNINNTYCYLAPNPSKGGKCNLYVSETCEVIVTDLTGNVISRNKAIPYFNNEINIQTPGLYLVKVNEKTLKLIVK